MRKELAQQVFLIKRFLDTLLPSIPVPLRGGINEFDTYFIKIINETAFTKRDGSWLLSKAISAFQTTVRTSMARAQFEYDEVGNTFYYVIVSFFAVVLFPLTHFLWPSLPKRQYAEKVGCQCEGDLAKRALKDAVKPWERTKCLIKAVILIVAWSLFIFLACKVSQIKHEHEADVSEIKKQYRELSKLHHPDKGGDAETFDSIVKAYKALTDEEARQNWKLHGNPDGPKATTFGIALPKWIVSEQYGIWVLACYGLVFMIILPVVVGLWWYNSMKYKTPNMEVNRILMVLAGSFEFWKKFNKEIVERESDDVEVPRLMKELKNLGENKKEAPFCHPWSVKARTLIHSYLTRVEIVSERLLSDQTYMMARALPLLEEYLRLRLFPMLVQALWPRNSTLLQLPHITEQNIPYLRKNRVATCQDLANLSESKRRSLLNTISPDQYEDVVYVLSMMPRLEVDARIEVQGEDDKETVTVGSVVTLRVTLKRSPLLDLSRREEEVVEDPKQEAEKEDNDDGAEVTKRKCGRNSLKRRLRRVAKVVASLSQPKRTCSFSKQYCSWNTQGNQKKDKESKLKKNQADNSDSDSDNDSASQSDSDSEEEEEETTGKQQDGAADHSSNDNDEDDIWDDHGELAKKETLLDSEPTDHHEVHCPFYPGDKSEWYLYLVERKSRRLVSMVVPCKTLDKEKTVELRFSAPPGKGTYYFTLNVRSDSYLDSDYSVDVKMEVHAAREPPVVKYEDTEDEDEEKDKSESSEDYTEGSDSEQE
uniref:J domain-containing protein n=1 Tax=Ditylenchus dipsaci TaxID=166011 RepID=A0A915EFI1_9BILA